MIDELGRDTVEARLQGLLVPLEALNSALVDDYEGFLSKRATEIQRIALELVGSEEEDGDPKTVQGEVLTTDEVTDESSAV